VTKKMTVFLTLRLHGQPRFLEDARVRTEIDFVVDISLQSKYKLTTNINQLNVFILFLTKQDFQLFEAE